jgi:hypothetical protein
MAEESTVSISDQIWQEWVARFASFSGKTLREALYEEWPLLIRKIMDFTPPFKTKGAPGSSDLSIGRAAVAFDIYKTMRPFNPAARTRSMERILERKDVQAFNALAARSKSAQMQGLTAVEFSPTRHLQQRDGRGRVRGRDRRKVVLGSDVGLLKNYVKKVQDRVGYAKSGWLAALLLTGGTAPGYVLKQGTGGGEVIDDHASEDPSITAINRTPWAIRKDEGERILADAKASRISSIMGKISTAIRLADKAAKGARAA